MHPQTIASLKDFRFWPLFMRAALSRSSRPIPCRFGNIHFKASPRGALALAREILVRRVYHFSSDTPAPRILDIGANIGLGTLYWKSIYPGAQIEAYEPDPDIFAQLQDNLRLSGASDVVAHNAAVWTERGVLRFSPDGGGGGRLDPNGSVGVECRPIADIFGNCPPYDLVKIDIEGAEQVVLPMAIPMFTNVRRVMFEWHSSPDLPQALGPILQQMSDAGFRYHLQSELDPEAPFMGIGHRFDNQVSVFCWRP